MVSEFAVSVFVGPNTFARADAYQRQGRVLDHEWSDDHLLLTGHVAGSDQQAYAVRVRLRATGAPELVTGPRPFTAPELLIPPASFLSVNRASLAASAP